MLLLGKEDHGAEFGQFTGGGEAVFMDGPLNVVPNVGRVVAVEVNDCLGQILNSLKIDPALRMHINGGLHLAELHR